MVVTGLVGTSPFQATDHVRVISGKVSSPHGHEVVAAGHTYVVRWTTPNGVNANTVAVLRSEEHTSELQSQFHLGCRLLLEKKKSIAPARRGPPPSALVHLRLRGLFGSVRSSGSDLFPQCREGLRASRTLPACGYVGR